MRSKKTALLAFTVFLPITFSSMVFAEGPSQVLYNLQTRSKAESWSFRVKDTGILANTVEQMTGLVKPKNYRSLAPYQAIYNVATLPERFDWRDTNGVSPVKNQGSCGSCWAFGTAAVMESLVQIKTGRVVDFSEQQLVSCQPDYGSCSGGYFAFGFYKKQGANYEDDFKYSARNVSCKTSAPKHHKITTFAYVGTSGRSPTTQEIKSAIHDYGPVAVTISATNAMMGYAGGIFNACSTAYTNHIVTLVGWDDRDQVWIVKNSWGTRWGEAGYMRIKYTDRNGRKCSRVGEDAVMLTSMPTE